MSEVQLESGWLKYLQPEFEAETMQSLRRFLIGEAQANKTIYPAQSEVYAALNTTPFDQVRVVILGQDPYHGPGQAHGLSFSVPDGARPPPSLKNIYKEIVSDLGALTTPQSGNLTSWAEQGVLLLNSVLTVEAHQAASHQGRGWEQFTDRIIEVLSEQREGLVFMLWGSYAQKKGKVIDQSKHCILSAPHPSPLSAHRGFLGCQHFSLCNAYLKDQGEEGIDWLSVV